ncbi:ribonuclease D [Euhalothece natronophila Z-M001]|uniref:Ribonuclease D n=1 Tax=Euhalothece natronophila Z-M001 TaxID=522448 RepID=A0A5B8NQ70_9CHRO|nr:ribonuclease D [Euhalothece natronophila]QDZ40315.1 ribonuclease D [Euhalothece natronophila Z-M001]
MDLSKLQVCDQDLSEDSLKQYLASEAIAVDTETMGLKPKRDRLCLVQLCDVDGNVTMIRIAKGQTQAENLKKLMAASNVLKVFHFARFDVAQLYHTFGVMTDPIFCTKIASKMARTYTSSHGLKTLVQELEKIELDKSSQSSDWGNAHNLSREQLSYAANDVRYLISMKAKLQQMLEREERWELAQECFKCIPTFVKLDLRQFDGIFEH